MIPRTKILQLGEIEAVVSKLRPKCARSKNARVNLVVFRLACSGLRVMEIVRLEMRDVLLDTPVPVLRLRKGNTKGGKPREVPIDWSAEALEDVKQWYDRRRREGARDNDPFVCKQAKGVLGKPFCETEAAKRWKTAIIPLGPQRVRQLSIHCGRHSFVSHSLASGVESAAIRDATGHASIKVLDQYAHPTDRIGRIKIYPGKSAATTP